MNVFFSLLYFFFLFILSTLKSYWFMEYLFCTYKRLLFYERKFSKNSSFVETKSWAKETISFFAYFSLPLEKPFSLEKFHVNRRCNKFQPFPIFSPFLSYFRIYKWCISFHEWVRYFLFFIWKLPRCHPRIILFEFVLGKYWKQDISFLDLKGKQNKRKKKKKGTKGWESGR